MLAKISKFRKELMGAAILLIMLCHSTVYIDSSAPSLVYHMLKQFSKIGVDLFLLLSGLGLFHSLSNDNNIPHFYKKRFMRILPQYIVVFLCWGVIAVSLSMENPAGYVWKYSLISFYTSGELATWFVAAIILLYLLFPLFFYLLQRGEKCIFAICVVLYGLSFFLTLSSTEGSSLRLINEAFIVRIPTFLAGMIIGKRIESGYPHSQRRIYPYILGAVICIAAWLIDAGLNPFFSRWFERVLFMPTAIFIAVVLSCWFEKCGAAVHKSLIFLGSITLEIYLIHEKVLSLYDTYIPKCTVGSLLSNASAVIVAILLSKLLSDIVGWAKRKIAN